MVWLILLFLMPSCTNTEEQLDDREIYEGAFQELADLELWYSDSAIVKLVINAAKVLEYENGDSEYPEGIYVEFYGKDSVITSTLEGDKAYYNKKKDLHQIVGNVKLESLIKKQKLNTEELFWDPKDKQVYTDKFVIIETEEDILYGEGLTAAQDFSSYRILNPTGELGFE